MALHAIAEKREYAIHKVSRQPYSKSNHQQTKQTRTNPMKDHWQDHQPDNKPFSIERPSFRYLHASPFRMLISNCQTG
ncbi:hypothetical protein BHZ80_27470 [Salmonella enterica]|nr:hypothetical protein [Salmonella enterica]EAA9594952.1 hypothetical protein [Salmonella enterica]EAO9637157.1 hypothetical protein [Salmonella enterica]